MFAGKSSQRTGFAGLHCSILVQLLTAFFLRVAWCPSCFSTFSFLPSSFSLTHLDPPNHASWSASTKSPLCFCCTSTYTHLLQLAVTSHVKLSSVCTVYPFSYDFQNLVYIKLLMIKMHFRIYKVIKLIALSADIK